MTTSEANPFAVTTAVDLSDAQINDYWVDLPGGAGFAEMAKPSSPMPMLIIGGKGSGKTHLMRYFSHPIQRLRHANDGLAAAGAEGYVGIYLRCSGLNASRFGGKGQDEEQWDAIFAYRMDLWLAQLTLSTLLAVCGKDVQTSAWNRSFLRRLTSECDLELPKDIASASALLEAIGLWQREIDKTVNNAAITRELNVGIRSTPGSLVFGVPRAFSSSFPPLESTTIAFLIDELENLAERQQRYIQTLIREKQSPSTFRIGARRYGVRTFKTYGSGEENREGSEYELLILDDRLRANRNYGKFARRLIASRLVQAGYFAADAETLVRVEDRLDSFFEQWARTPLAEDQTSFVVEKYRGRMRPYLEALKGKLDQGLRSRLAPGVSSKKDIRLILDQLSFKDDPLIEKVSVHLFYGCWARNENLANAAKTIRKECTEYLAAPESGSRVGSVLSHFKDDLIAQLRRECDSKQYYLGTDAFVAMSKGLPRNLLIILKHVFQWAAFRGETPFSGKTVSREAQRLGVLEAARWFLHDAEVLGRHSAMVRALVQRLGDLFKGIRFSDKPAECSLTTFSVNRTALSAEAVTVLREAEKWSLLIEVAAGQKDRNSGRLDYKYQMNPMLCPLWDLAISRRGAIALTAVEANAICADEQPEQFEEVKRIRLARMNAPFRESTKDSGAQMSLLTHD